MEIRFKRDTSFRKQFFVPDSFSHPAKLDAQLQIWIVERYTKAGETILDPMFGSGTLMLACMLSRNVIGVELEQKFVDMAKANWEKVRMHPQLGYDMGSCQILQGDARNLEGLLVDKCVFSPPHGDAYSIREGGQVNKEYVEKRKEALRKQGKDKLADSLRVEEYGSRNPDNLGNLPYGQIDKIVTSPPYAETGVGDWQTGRAEFQAWVINEIATKGYVEWQGKRYTESEWRAMNYGRIDGRTTKGVHKHPTDGYGKEEGQLGNLPYGNIDRIITSPPYEEAMGKKHHSPRADKLAKEKSNPVTYTDAIITSPPYEGSVSASAGGERDQSSARQREARLRSKGYDPKEYQGGVGRNLEVDFQYSKADNNIGNLKSSSYLEAMLQVYQQCFKVLRPQGLMILVVKNFIREQKEVDLRGDTVKLCEQSGFSFVEEHHRILPSQSFWRVIYAKRFPDAPKIDREYVLVFKKRVN